ncbi:hypothetical protein NOAM109506_03475 [Nosocomiicoccus ampullae]|uniref:Uncharacterized protein n=1 Tax=Nosocomiicoccus ampullae TaxID=489910 RepID=A0A9Q2HE27_9STAP|nr:hypothetical protein [Nosocomiicoccus ampullae]
MILIKIRNDLIEYKERACSKYCTKVIIEDIVKNWLNTQNKIEYFYTDVLEDKIITQIEDV